MTDAVPPPDDAPSRGRPVHTPDQDQPRPVEPIQRLWAPWRFAYITGEGRVDGCPFCVLPERGPERDRESLILHRGDACYVIFNAYPYNPGHLMVVPFEHVPEVEHLDDPVADELWRLGRRIVPILKERLGADGINLGINLGRAAGAGIAEHLHMHVVPRWEADTNFISVVGSTRVLPRSLDEMYDELAPAFQDL